MTIIKDKNNILKMYQGDTGRIKFKGFPTDKNYKVCFSILNNRNKIISEIQENSNKKESIIFKITQDISNKLIVAPNLRSQTYYYGIKLCDLEIDKEKTMNIGSCKFGEKNKIIVFPKKAEGI